MKGRNWLAILILTMSIFIGIPVAAVMIYNYQIDPLWNFDHSNDKNNAQRAFDERLQKINYMNSHEMDYDSLLIGSSRVTYLNSTEFKDEKVLNLSLSSIHIDEYLNYILYAQSLNDKPFNKIYIELYNNLYLSSFKQTANSLDYYTGISEAPFYKIKSLFSYDTLLKSRENARYAEEIPDTIPRLYKRNLDTFNEFTPYKESRVKELLTNALNKDGTYEYYPEFKTKLEEIKKAFPNAEIIAFSDLLPMENLKLTNTTNNRIDLYNQYVRDVVDVFGSFYSFHNSNYITENYDGNFFDYFHFNNQIGAEVIRSLENPEDSEIVEVITDQNIRWYEF